MLISEWRTNFYPNICDIYPSVVRKLYKKGEVIILDIRQPWEYEDHHIPGAILLPLDYFDTLFHIFLKNVKASSVAIICEHANRSTRLVYGKPYLFKGIRTYNVLGGMELWMKMGYEVDKGIDENGKIWVKLLQK